MPNWCSGNIRFRGSKENILNLLKNEIIFCSYGEDRKIINHPITVNGDDIDDIEIVSPSTEKGGWYYINGTERAFMDWTDSFTYPNTFHENRDTNQCICVFDGFRQAWSIEPENFKAMSEKYDVDIRIFGWEMGMCFSQEVEIIRGKVTKDIYNDYDYGKNWNWDCPMCFLGG